MDIVDLLFGHLWVHAPDEYSAKEVKECNDGPLKFASNGIQPGRSDKNILGLSRIPCFLRFSKVCLGFPWPLCSF